MPVGLLQKNHLQLTPLADRQTERNRLPAALHAYWYPHILYVVVVYNMEQQSAPGLRGFLRGPCCISGTHAVSSVTAHQRCQHMKPSHNGNNYSVNGASTGPGVSNAGQAYSSSTAVAAAVAALPHLAAPPLHTVQMAPQCALEPSQLSWP